MFLFLLLFFYRIVRRVLRVHRLSVFSFDDDLHTGGGFLQIADRVGGETFVYPEEIFAGDRFVFASDKQDGFFFAGFLDTGGRRRCSAAGCRRLSGSVRAVLAVSKDLRCAEFPECTKLRSSAPGIGRSLCSRCRRGKLLCRDAVPRQESLFFLPNGSYWRR